MHPRLMLTWSCALSSFLLLGVWFGLALHVRIGLGRWPTPMIDNYNTPAFALHFQALVCAWVFALYIAVPLALVLLCFRPLRGTLKLHGLQALVYAAGWGAILLSAWIDPFRFVTWMLD